MAGALITSDFQIQLGPDSGGLLLGAGTPYDVIELDGWDDMPPLSLTDVDRPAQAGAWAGPMYPQPRVLTLTLGVSGTVGGIGTVTVAQYAANVAALRKATNPAGSDTTVESPFVVQLAGQQLQATVRCQQRVMPTTQGYSSPGLDRVTLQLVATDSRRYSPTVQSASCGLASTSGGLAYPITYPITWGTVSPGTLTITNSGDTPTPPTLTITGPGTTPAIVRQDTGQILLFNLTLSTTDVLVVNTLDGTVTLNGASVYGALDPSSAPIASLLMAPGTTTLGLRVASGTGTTLTATWQNAYL